MNTPPLDPASVMAVTSAEVSCLPAYIWAPEVGAGAVDTGEGARCPLGTGGVATAPPSIVPLHSLLTKKYESKFPVQSTARIACQINCARKKTRPSFRNKRHATWIPFGLQTIFVTFSSLLCFTNAVRHRSLGNASCSFWTLVTAKRHVYLLRRFCTHSTCLLLFRKGHKERKLMEKVSRVHEQPQRSQGLQARIQDFGLGGPGPWGSIASPNWFSPLLFDTDGHWEFALHLECVQ